MEAWEGQHLAIILTILIMKQSVLVLGDGILLYIPLHSKYMDEIVGRLKIWYVLN